jgi:hypothetical protein
MSEPELLIEKDAVATVVNKLFISTDNRDWDSVKECFSESVLFDFTSAGGGEPAVLSPEQITNGWQEGLKNLKAIHHQSGNFIIDIDNETAHVFCYGIAIHYLPNSKGQNTRTFVGSYNFQLVKRNSLWLINKFRFNLKFIDGNSDLEKSI